MKEINSLRVLPGKVLLFLPELSGGKTAGGLILPDILKPDDESLIEATVAEYAVERRENGSRIQLDIKPGDRILVRAFDVKHESDCGRAVTVCGKSCVFVNPAAVSAVLE